LIKQAVFYPRERHEQRQTKAKTETQKNAMPTTKMYKADQGKTRENRDD
jgi:hypothetical protein